MLGHEDRWPPAWRPWDPPAPPRLLWVSDDLAAPLPWLGDDVWPLPRPWPAPWLTRLVGTDESMPGVEPAIPLEADGWRPPLPWVREAPPVAALLDDTPPPPQANFLEGEAGEAAWWLTRLTRPPWGQTFRLATWDAWAPFAPPVEPEPAPEPGPAVGPVVTLITTHAGRTYGRTVVTLSASEAVAEASRLEALAVVPDGTRIVLVVYDCTAAFGTSGGLTAVDIGEPTMQDRWGHTVGITLGTVTSYAIGRGALWDVQVPQTLWVSALGGPFDAVGVCTLTVLWEQVAVTDEQRRAGLCL